MSEKQQENPLVIVNDILIDGKTASGNITIPNNVTSISANAFYNCKELTNITIPESVTNIGEYAFCLCENLKKLVIPESVEKIEEGSFATCKQLKEVIILNKDIQIDEDSFDKNTKIIIKEKRNLDEIIKDCTIDSPEEYIEQELEK